MEDRTPVLIGAGQFTERNIEPRLAQPPMGIAAEAAKAALLDCGNGRSVADAIDTLVAIRIFPDSWNRPRMPNPFGRAENPPRAIARRIGANPSCAIYGNVGGNTPQKYINEMAERIAEGESEVVLLAGSEAIKTAQQALRQDVELDWQEEDEGSLEDRGIGEKLATPHEFAHGLGVPIQTYPLFENALRGKAGRTIDQQLLKMGELFAPFTEVAAKNPFSLYGAQRTAIELATVTDENRYISLPYPKWMNAMDGVNQGAAVIMTSVAKARELGIDQSKWVFLHGCGEANEKILVSERRDYYSAPAIGVNSAKALEMADKTIADMDFIDIYSCFPSAVEISCEELGIKANDPRGLTVTGGLPFFGGPGNNYSMHAIATMCELLRGKPGTFGLITANGGYLTKHATGVYSTEPFQGNWKREDPARYQSEVDQLDYPSFTETPSGMARIETYTVCFKRGVPYRGIVIGRQLSDDARFIANTQDDEVFLQRFLSEEQLGRQCSVSQREDLNIIEIV